MFEYGLVVRLTRFIEEELPYTLTFCLYFLRGVFCPFGFPFVHLLKSGVPFSLPFDTLILAAGLRFLVLLDGCNILFAIVAYRAVASGP